MPASTRQTGPVKPATADASLAGGLGRLRSDLGAGITGIAHTIGPGRRTAHFGSIPLLAAPAHALRIDQAGSGTATPLVIVHGSCHFRKNLFKQTRFSLRSLPAKLSLDFNQRPRQLKMPIEVLRFMLVFLCCRAQSVSVWEYGTRGKDRKALMLSPQGD
jgi:hypothetical protein